MEASHEAFLRMKIQTPHAETILKSIQPELSSLPSQRLKASLEIDGNDLVINLHADDLVALRAGLNTFLRWVIALDNTLQAITDKLKRDC